MGWIKEFVARLLKINPAASRRITIKEPLTFCENVLKNQIWYRGNPSELEQFFKQTAVYGSDNVRFWAAVPFGKVRKIHSGIVGIVIDRYWISLSQTWTGSVLETGNQREKNRRYGIKSLKTVVLENWLERVWLARSHREMELLRSV